MNKLPNGWQEKKLKDISDITSSKRIYEFEYVSIGIPFYRGKEITALKNKQKIENFIYISEARYNELKENYGVPKKDDILITAVGTIGNAYTIENDKPFYFKDGNLLWLKNIKEYPKFLEYLFENSKKIFIDNSFGSSQHALTISKLANLTFNFPPLEEQKRIASALSKVDAYLENTIKLTESKERFKRAITKKLLTCKENKNVPEARFEGFEDEWETVKLGDITRMSSGGTPNTKIKEYYNGDITWVTISDITNSYKYLYDTEKNITKLGLQNSSAKIFSINTILYAIYGSIGECAISKVECATSQAILGIECSDRINYNFLYYLLFNYKNDAKKLKQQGTQPNLNKQIVLNFHFKIPSIKEQEKIGEFLSLLDTEIDNLKKQAEGIKRLKKGLMKKLMSGEIRI